MCNDDYARKMIIDYLDQVHYWLKRFEESRNVDHLDYTKNFANVVRGYLPRCLKGLNLIGLENLYWNLSANKVSDKGGF